MQNWNSPIIITTLVQFLDTLFGGKTSQVRRFHSLCDSIIILDEVQTVPTKMLSLFNLAVNFLAVICHATIILCYATQPLFEETKHSLLEKPEELVSNHDITHLMPLFRRNTVPDLNVEEVACM